MFQKCNEKRAFLPEQFDIFTVRSFHRHFGEYKHAKSSDKKYAKILIDHKIADEIKETSFLRLLSSESEFQCSRVPGVLENLNSSL